MSNLGIVAAGVISKQQDVHTRLHRQFDAFLQRIVLSDGSHLHVIRHHHTLESQLLAQHAGDHGIGQGGRIGLIPLSAVQMGHHDQIRKLLAQKGAERLKFRFRPKVGDIGQTQMAVLLAGPVTWKMLHGGQDTGSMEFLDSPAGMALDPIGLGSITAFQSGDNGIVRIHGQIQYGCKIEVDSQRGQQFAHFSGTGSSPFLIIPSTQFSLGGGGGKAVPGLETCNLSPFLIDGDQKRHLGNRLKLSRQFLDLLRGNDISHWRSSGNIPVKQDHSTQVKIFYRLKKGIPFFQVGPPESHHQHLPDPEIEAVLFFRSTETAQEG